MRAHEVILTCRRTGLTLRIVDDGIGVKPSRRLTSVLDRIIQQYKSEMVEVLQIPHAAREERAAILEYDHVLDGRIAEREATRRVFYVTCGSCTDWTVKLPCKDGFHTTGGLVPGVAARICSRSLPSEAAKFVPGRSSEW